MNKLKAFAELIFDIVDETTSLVEKTHHEVIDRSLRRFAPIEPAKAIGLLVSDTQKAIAGGVYASIHGINDIARLLANLAAKSADKAGWLTQRSAGDIATPIRSDAFGTFSWVVDYSEALINGLFGDYLSKHKRALDLGMSVRVEGRVLPLTQEAFAQAFPNAHNKLCVFVHGLSSTEWLWSLDAQEYYGDPTTTFGTMLERDAAYTPIYIRYNSGRHISENGRALCELLNEIITFYPVTIDEIALIGHSMGGLITRSAAHYARETNAPWLLQLRDVFMIGSPNLGAPLEKSVNLLTGLLSMIDAAGAQVPASLLNARSVGIKDLRYGYTIDEEWQHSNLDEVWIDRRQQSPLLEGVNYYFASATITKDPEHPLGQLVGDLLVRPRSAAGHAPEPERRVPFKSGCLVTGMNHLDLANHPAVYELLRESLISDVSAQIDRSLPDPNQDPVNQ